MPTNKKEGIYFGTMMCFGMVFVMTFYNLTLNGLISELTFMEGLMSFVTGFVIALVLDLFFVGPHGKKIALKLLPENAKMVSRVIVTSTCMVLGMASCMSFYGLLTAYAHGGLVGQSILSSYIMILAKNLIVALPLQLIVIGPLVRLLFVKFIQKNDQAILSDSSMSME